jgi:Flp pilus assembly protein TadD
MFFLTLQPRAARAPELEVFTAMARDPAHLPADVAALARLFLLLAGAPNLEDRVARMPAISTLPPRALDWDAIIAEGEALLAVPEDQRRYLGDIGCPLADAYHQRAIAAWSRGDGAGALRDADRAVALDPRYLPYTNTRAVLLDAVGRSDEARAALDDAIARFLMRKPKVRDDRPFFPTSPAEHARAHATRGLAALREGAIAEAEIDLRRAVRLRPESALYAHALGAALYAAGDIEGAAEAEARSVELDPANTRYRWALVGSLRALGRGREAQEHASMIVQQEPHVAAHREKLARLLARSP